MTGCIARVTPVHKFVENDWILFTDENQKTRIVAVINNELCWRLDGRPGEWHMIKAPITYDPKQRVLAAIGLRTIVLSVLSAEFRGQREKVMEHLANFQMCSKTDSWFERDNREARQLGEAAEEAKRKLKEATETEVEGNELSSVLRRLASFADNLSMPHNLLAWATVTKATMLDCSANGQHTVQATEKVIVLSMEGTLPRVLNLESGEYPCFDGEYVLNEKVVDSRPTWRHGAMVIYAKSGAWAVGWEYDVKKGDAYLLLRGSKTPSSSRNWLKSDGSGGWTSAPSTSVKVCGPEGPRSLVDYNGRIGYIKSSRLLLDSPMLTRNPGGRTPDPSPPPQAAQKHPTNIDVPETRERVPIAIASAASESAAPQRPTICKKRSLDWIVVVSKKKKTGTTYYYNKRTKKKQWQPPPELAEPEFVQLL